MSDLKGIKLVFLVQYCISSSIAHSARRNIIHLSKFLITPPVT